METYCCQYATDSAEIKDRWELTMTRGESQAVLEMLDPCQNLPGVATTRLASSWSVQFRSGRLWGRR